VIKGCDLARDSNAFSVGGQPDFRRITAVQRSTRQRHAIQEALDAASGPLLPEEIWAAARSTVPSLGQATVYRTLTLLEAEGHLRRVAAIDGRTRYELERGHHHHFLCRSCDRAYDIDGCRSPDSTWSRQLPAGFVLEGHELWLRGLCAECA